MANYSDVFEIGGVEKPLISKGMGVVEDVSGSGTASQAYTSGSYFVGDDGYMWKAKSAIASGATIVVSGSSANVEQTTIAVELGALGGALTNEATTRANADTALGNRTTALESDVADLTYGNAGAHNAIYRGKNLGTSVTAAQYTAISNGTFDDMYIGDYWVINSVTWRIAAFDYWQNNGGATIDHHVVIVPDSNLTSCKMNDTNITTGGYVGSDFYTGNNSNTGRATAISAVNSAFGSAHILTYKDYLINHVTDGHPDGQVWQDCTVELMNEAMVYGGKFFEPMANGTTVYSNYTVSKSQLPLFQHDHSRICNRATWWLRGVVSSATFAYVAAYGSANSANASGSRGVRPAFAIKA